MLLSRLFRFEALARDPAVRFAAVAADAAAADDANDRCLECVPASVWRAAAAAAADADHSPSAAASREKEDPTAAASTKLDLRQMLVTALY